MGIFRFNLKRKDHVKVSVQLLDDAETITSEFKRSDPAQAILDYVLEVMNIKEKDYFGLRYQDHSKHRYWVDLSRSISHIEKQFKFPDTLMLRLRFRFYPNDPHLLKEEITRYQLFVQLQRDLLHGRLYCPQQTAMQLAALVLQSQLGDYNPEKHGEHYASQYKLLLKQTPRIEDRIEELHQEMKGKLTASDAELQFLEKACELDTYGFDPYTVKDSRDPMQAVYIGVTHRGVLIYKGNIKAHHIPWSQLSKVDYFGKEVRIIPKDDYVPPIQALEAGEDGTLGTPDKKRRLVIRLQCPCGVFAKHLWTHILSEQAFFNEQAAALVKPKFSKPRVPLLGRGSTFRFPSRRVLREIEASFEEEPAREEVSFSRYQLPRQEPRKEVPWLSKNHTLPNAQPANGGFANVSISEATKEEDKENATATPTPSLLEEMARLVKEGTQPAIIEEEQRIAAGRENTVEEEVEHDLALSFDMENQKSLDSVINGIPSLHSDASSPSSGFVFSTTSTSRDGSPTAVVACSSSFMQNTPEPDATPSSLLSDSSIGDPLMTSTPTSRATVRETAVRRSVAAADAVATALKPSTSQGNGSALSNGYVANGDTHHATTSSDSSVQQQQRPSSSTLRQRVVNTFFASFLLFLLLVTLAIAVFENRGTSRDSDWVSRSAFLSHVRHDYYEPARQALVAAYGRVLSIGK